MQNDASFTGPPNAFGIYTLTDAACREVLARQRLCVISTVDGEQPYAVPVFYGFDGTTVYLGIAEGRKTAVLDRNPNLCVTIAEVGPGDAWRSVVVAGRAEFIADPDERASAVQVMMEHNRRPDRPPPTATTSASASPQHHRGGRMVRIADAVITGRAKP